MNNSLALCQSHYIIYIAECRQRCWEDCGDVK